MTREESDNRKKSLRAGVREDGTVEGYAIETYLANIYALMHPNQWGWGFDFENKFVSFTTDAGAVDEEVRLPFEVVDFLHQRIHAGPPSDADAAELARREAEGTR